MKRSILIAGAAAALLIAGVVFWNVRPSRSGEQHAPGGAETWTCSMHPGVKLPQPGKCPICEMPLIRAGGVSGVHGGMLHLANGGAGIVETAAVVRRPLQHTLRALGKVGYNETGLATITSRVEGYVENLFVNFTGVEVKKGDHLVEIYSPELAVAQRELLLGRSDPADRVLQDAARKKMERWGLLPEQIDEFLRSGKVSDRVTLQAPIGGTVTEKMVVQNSMVKPGEMLYRLANLESVWLFLDIYEYELGRVRYGQEVTATTESYPGETFTGRVWFISPVLSEETRTVKVTVSLENKNRKLKPGMFVSAGITVALLADGTAAPSGVEGKWTCPMHPHVLAEKSGECAECHMALEQIPGTPVSADAPQPLAIPASAVLDSGLRKIVHIERDTGMYAAQEVKLGLRAGDYYPVLDGLAEGDRVVVRGNFLLDSQFQIAGLPSLFYPDGQAPAAGHSGHEGHGTEPAKVHAPKPAEHKH
jgi:Cu(I)/Ag(I) efflux system membrane fusion protein